MPATEVEIVPCPAAHSREAIALVLREIAPEQRAIIAGPQSSVEAVDGLWIARRGGELLAAAWVQRQPGNTAIFWPPQVCDADDTHLAVRLGEAVVDSLDAAGLGMAQVLLLNRQAAGAATLESIGFHYLADLLYLHWETADTTAQPKSGPPSSDSHTLTFEPFVASQHERLIALVENTYAGTQDCAAMNGKRSMEEVIDGYQATGVFRPENWLFVRNGSDDVGVLLLADHPAAKHFELVYMALIPEVRGRGWGLRIARHAQQVAIRAGARRVVLAVDAANRPALAMYRDAGFAAWDQRAVFVRFAGG